MGGLETQSQNFYYFNLPFNFSGTWKQYFLLLLQGDATGWKPKYQNGPLFFGGRAIKKYLYLLYDFSKICNKVLVVSVSYNWYPTPLRQGGGGSFQQNNASTMTVPIANEGVYCDVFLLKQSSLPPSQKENKFWLI